MDGTFLSGCIVGFFIASIFGVILNQIILERKKVGKHRKPQMAMVQTSKTPEQVIQDHRAAMVNIFLWAALGIILISIPIFFISLTG